MTMPWPAVDPDAYTTGEPVPPDPVTEDVYDPMVVTLQNVEQQGNTALVNLQAAITQAEQAMAQMQVRVELGQMGAESIPALETAIAEAKQVQSEMTTQVADVQAQQEQILEAAAEQAAQEQEAAASGTTSE